MQRIQKIIASSGFCSRRKAEELITKGKVKVNGKIAKIGDKASEDDIILVDGKRITNNIKKVYIALYKPKGIVCSCRDEKGRKTVVDLIRGKIKERVYPVGRLDRDSEGLVILTNDGEYANTIMHPRYGKEKEYIVFLDKEITDNDINKINKGVYWDKIKVLADTNRISKNLIKITIKEGRKHIVKNILKKIGYEVKNLKRTRIDDIRLGKLKPGEFIVFVPKKRE